MNRVSTIRLGLIAAAAIAIAGGAVVAMEPELSKIHKRIVADYENVEHIDGDQFLDVNDANDVIVFDVREPSEYDVSHINGAIQIDPKIKAADFIETYGDKVEGKTVVFYCSVGRRSSLLAERVDTALEEAGASASYNLIGGIFQWHNENRPLTSQAQTSTKAIHPYNNHWGRLISDKSSISYKPSVTNERTKGETDE